MSARSRVLVAVATASVLAGFAALLGGGDQEAAPALSADVAERPSRVELERQVAAKIERAEEVKRVVEAKEEDPDGEPGPSERDLGALAKLGAEAMPGARRFLRAFAAYEVGEAGSEERAILRETASPELVEELLSSPPRVPLGAAAPEAARLGKVEFVPGKVERGRVVSAELVGELRRGGGVEPIAIELGLSAGEWLVLGLGR